MTTVNGRPSVLPPNLRRFACPVVGGLLLAGLWLSSLQVHDAPPHTLVSQRHEWTPDQPMIGEPHVGQPQITEEGP